MERFRRKNDIVDERVIGFKSEPDIWNHIEDIGTRSFIILFNETSPNNHLSYTIRSKSNNFMTDQQYSKDLPTIANKFSNEYISGGFLALQHAMDFTYFEIVTNRVDSAYRVELERLPSPASTPMRSKISDLGLYIIIFSAFISISLIFTRVVEEKACGFREQLKNATRFSFLNNIALFTVNYVQMLLLFSICLAITYFKGLWFSVNIFYPTLLIIAYLVSIISFTFLVSAFFESSMLIVICKFLITICLFIYL